MGLFYLLYIIKNTTERALHFLRSQRTKVFTSTVQVPVIVFGNWGTPVKNDNSN